VQVQDRKPQFNFIRTREGGYACRPLVFTAYHHHGAVGVANYGIGDASHKGSSNSTAAAAAHDYQSRAYFFSHSHNLYVGVTFPEVSPHNFPPGFFDLSGLSIEERSGLSSRRFWFCKAITVSVRDWQDAAKTASFEPSVARRILVGKMLIDSHLSSCLLPPSPFVLGIPERHRNHLGGYLLAEHLDRQIRTGLGELHGKVGVRYALV